jgi:ribosome-associated protein
MSKTREIEVNQLPIRLGQFLKLADLVQDGLEAKIRVRNGEVLVNNEIELKRGKKLQRLDEVCIGEVRVRIV